MRHNMTDQTLKTLQEWQEELSRLGFHAQPIESLTAMRCALVQAEAINNLAAAIRESGRPVYPQPEPRY